MDKEREEILNDLIQYYDGGKKADLEAEPEAKLEAETAQEIAVNISMGDTITVPTVKNAADKTDDDMGHTRVVKSSDPAAFTAQTEKVTDIPDEELLADNSTKAAPVTEEILGCLDLSGKPIDPTFQQESAKEEPKQEEDMPKQRQKAEYYEPEEAPKKRSGIWYSLKPLWVTMIACAIVAAGFEFYRTEDGFIGTYKKNFNDNMRVIFDKFGWDWIDYDKLQIVGKAEGNEKLLAANDTKQTVVNGNPVKSSDSNSNAALYKKIGDKKTVIPFADAGNAVVMESGKGIVCAKSNYACYIGSNGKLRWEEETTISNPVADVGGRFLVIATKGGKQICLYRDNKLQYTFDAENIIRDCKVSAKGDVVLITDKPSYKGAIIMINRKGEKVFSWSSGVNYITGVQVLNNRRIAVALSNTDDRVTSYLMMFNINSNDPESGVEIKDSLLYDVFTDGKTICLNGDNCISKLTSDGAVQYEHRFDDVGITHSANDYVNGTRVLTYTEKNLPYLAMYDKKGNITESYRIENTPDFLSAYGTTIAYNNGRTIICGNIRDEVKTAYRVPREIKKLTLLSNSSYAVVYGDCIEIVRF